jgi:hypothetical protein
MKTTRQLWNRFEKGYWFCPAIGLSVDVSRMSFPNDYLPSMKARMQWAFAAMADFERGGIANRGGKRMVGHFWARNPVLAPLADLRREIEQTVYVQDGVASGDYLHRFWLGTRRELHEKGSELEPLTITDVYPESLATCMIANQKAETGRSFRKIPTLPPRNSRCSVANVDNQALNPLHDLLQPVAQSRCNAQVVKDWRISAFLIGVLIRVFGAVYQVV